MVALRFATPPRGCCTWPGSDRKMTDRTGFRVNEWTRLQVLRVVTDPCSWQTAGGVCPLTHPIRTTPARPILGRPDCYYLSLPRQCIIRLVSGTRYAGQWLLDGHLMPSSRDIEQAPMYEQSQTEIPVCDSVC